MFSNWIKYNQANFLSTDLFALAMSLSERLEEFPQTPASWSTYLSLQNLTDTVWEAFMDSMEDLYKYDR